MGEEERVEEFGDEAGGGILNFGLVETVTAAVTGECGIGRAGFAVAVRERAGVRAGTQATTTTASGRPPDNTSEGAKGC